MTPRRGVAAAWLASAMALASLSLLPVSASGLDAATALKSVGVAGELDDQVAFSPLSADVQRQLFNSGVSFELGDLSSSSSGLDDEGEVREVIDVHGRLGLPGQVVSYRIVGGKPRFEGDITLPRDMLEPPSLELPNLLTRRRGLMEPFAVVAVTTDRWEGGVIHYCVDRRIPSSQRKDIDQAVSEWNARLADAVLWREAPGASDDGFCDNTGWRPRVRFTPIAGDTCYSMAGRAGPGEQEIELARSCIRKDILHEMGHAAGLLHEHSRRDRHHWVRICKNNVRADAKSAFDQPTRPTQALTVYDYGSVMHYGPYAFSNDKGPTIVALKPTNVIGGDVLSDSDVFGVRDLYRRRAVVSEPTLRLMETAEPSSALQGMSNVVLPGGATCE